MRSRDYMGFPEGEAMTLIEDITHEEGRYVLSVSRYGRAGHSVIAERHADGSLLFVDAQSDELYAGDSAISEFGNAYYISAGRIDNAVINPDAIADFIEVA